ESASGPDSSDQPKLPLATGGEDEEAPISLVPDSLPPESIDPESVDPDSLRVGGMVALSAGTLQEGKGKPKPPPPRRGSTGTKSPDKKPEAPRAKHFPKPPPAPPKTKADFLVSDPDNEAPSAEAAEKPQVRSKPKPPANLKRPETVSFDPEDLPPDSAPDVGALSRKFASEARPDAETLRKRREDEDLLRMGAVSLGDSVMGVDESAPLAPTIDVSNLDTSSSEAPPSGKKRKKKRKAKSGPPSSRRVSTDDDVDESPAEATKDGAKKASDARSMPSEAPVTRSKPADKSVAAEPSSSESEGGSRMPLYVGLGLVAAFAIYWFGVRPGAEPESSTKPVATDLKRNEPAATSKDEATPPPTSEPAETAEPAASAEREKAEAPQSPSEAPDNPTPPTKNPAETSERPTATEKPSAPSEKPEATKPEEPAEKPTEKPSEPTPPAEAAGPFDVGAARAALASAAAAAGSCRKEGDPSGMAHVTITFAPSGRATSANISGPPFAGTATGGCIAATMRRAKVPPFSGGYKTVSKTVVIQ
ncbi:MAG: hypothetical protein KC766_19295, partial [Myxococcales bacterium]|nr:hypothetical protein [Myxococcales bacterium]